MALVMLVSVMSYTTLVKGQSCFQYLTPFCPHYLFNYKIHPILLFKGLQNLFHYLQPHRHTMYWHVPMVSGNYFLSSSALTFQSMFSTHHQMTYLHILSSYCPKNLFMNSLLSLALFPKVHYGL